MASIIKRTEDVAKACDAALLDVEIMRKDAQDYLVAEKMQETTLSFTGKVPKYATREDAIEALKNEYGYFGNSWSTAGVIGFETKSQLKLLRAMCRCAGVIRLDSKDFAVLRGYI